MPDNEPGPHAQVAAQQETTGLVTVLRVPGLGEQLAVGVAGQGHAAHGAPHVGQFGSDSACGIQRTSPGCKSNG